MKRPPRFSEMFWRPLFSSVLLCCAVMAVNKAAAVDQIYGGSDHYFGNDPTQANAASNGGNYIPGWTTGWGEAGIDGWDYVGLVYGTVTASGVYLGNNWVITAAHVGAGAFSLAGVTYDMVPGSAVGISNSTGTADMTLFQISTAPGLPRLTISSRPPTPEVTQVAMIGYGPGGSEDWGYNTVTSKNVNVQVNSDVTVDFETAFETTANGNNDAEVVSGDSGGGDFTYNSRTSEWEVAGINEANDADKDSYLEQLSTYSSQINAITATPVVPNSPFITTSALGLFLVAGLYGMKRTARG